MTLIEAMSFAVIGASCTNDEPAVYYSYKAKGAITAYPMSDDTLGIECAVAEYNGAMIAVMRDDRVVRCIDNAIKRTCNTVYHMHRKNHPSWNGYVEILRYEYNAGGERVAAVIIKIYNYYEDY